MYICITELLCYITKINNIVNELHINKKNFFFCLIIKKKKNVYRDFPGGPVVKNLAYQGR